MRPRRTAGRSGFVGPGVLSPLTVLFPVSARIPHLIQANVFRLMAVNRGNGAMKCCSVPDAPDELSDWAFFRCRKAKPFGKLSIRSAYCYCSIITEICNKGFFSQVPFAAGMPGRPIVLIAVNCAQKQDLRSGKGGRSSDFSLPGALAMP